MLTDSIVCGFPTWGTGFPLSAVPFSVSYPPGTDLVDHVLGMGHFRDRLYWDFAYGPARHSGSGSSWVPSQRPVQLAYNQRADASVYSFALSESMRILTGASSVPENMSEHGCRHIKLIGDLTLMSSSLYDFVDDTGYTAGPGGPTVPGFSTTYSVPTSFGSGLANQAPMFRYDGVGDPDLRSSFDVVGAHGSPIYIGDLAEIYRRAKKGDAWVDLPECTGVAPKFVSLDGRQYLRGVKVEQHDYSLSFEYETLTYVPEVHFIRRLLLSCVVEPDHTDRPRVRLTWNGTSRLYISHNTSPNYGNPDDIPGWFHYPWYDQSLFAVTYATAYFPLTTRESATRLQSSLKKFWNFVTSSSSIERYNRQLASVRPSIHHAIHDGIDDARVITGNLVETSMKLESLSGLFGLEEAENLARTITKSDIGKTIEGYPLPVTVAESLESLGGIRGVFGLFARFVGSCHLLYRFGWRPLSVALNSAIDSGGLATAVNDGIIRLGELLNDRSVFKGSYKLSKTDYGDLACDRLIVHTKFQLVPLHGLLAAIAGLDRLQFLPTPDRAFASIPFSWAVDWGISASERASMISDFILLTLYGGNNFTHSYKMIHELTKWQLRPFGLSYFGRPPEISVYYRERSRYVPAVGFRDGAVIPFVPHHPDVGLLVSLALALL